MTCILLATDLSAAAARALPWATRLAKALTQELVLLHVVHDPVLAPALTSSTELDRRQAAEAVAALAAGLGPGVRGEVRVAADVVGAVEQAAVELRARYLVVAATGKSGWQRAMLGSVASALILRGRIPTVCVPARAAEAGKLGSRLLVTLDRSPASLRALGPAAALAAALGLPLTLLGVQDEPAPSLDDWREWLVAQAAALPAATEVDAVAVQGRKPADAIVAWAHAHDVALVCLASHGRTGFRRLLLGSVAQAVLHGLRVPTVVVPAE